MLIRFLITSRNIIDADDDEYDSSDEDDFAPVPEDLIQGSMTEFVHFIIEVIG